MIQSVKDSTLKTHKEKTKKISKNSHLKTYMQMRMGR